MSRFIPNSFQIPNSFVDEYLDSLSGKAIKSNVICSLHGKLQVGEKIQIVFLPLNLWLNAA